MNIKPSTFYKMVELMVKLGYLTMLKPI